MNKDSKGGRSYSSFEQRLSSVKLRESLRNECNQYYGVSRDIIKQLESELSIDQLMKVLELERVLNDLRVKENKLNYELGVKDGMDVWKELKE